MKTLSVLPCGHWDAGENMGCFQQANKLLEHEAPRVAALVSGLRVRFEGSRNSSVPALLQTQTLSNIHDVQPGLTELRPTPT